MTDSKRKFSIMNLKKLNGLGEINITYYNKDNH